MQDVHCCSEVVVSGATGSGKTTQAPTLAQMSQGFLNTRTDIQDIVYTNRIV